MHIQASNILRTCELLQCSEVHDLYITGKRRRVVEALQREPAAALRQTSRWNWIRVLGSKWSIGSARPFLAGCCYTITTLKTRLCCEHCFELNCDERLHFFSPQGMEVQVYYKKRMSSVTKFNWKSANVFEHNHEMVDLWGTNWRELTTGCCKVFARNLRCCSWFGSTRAILFLGDKAFRHDY